MIQLANHLIIQKVTGIPIWNIQVNNKPYGWVQMQKHREPFFFRIPIELPPADEQLITQYLLSIQALTE